MMQDSDLQIIRKIQQGEVNNFREIVDSYKYKAFSLVSKIIKNREEAEDTLQDAFLKLFRAIVDKQFEEKSRFSTYLYSVVYNTAVDHYRKYYNKKFNITSIDINESAYHEGDELTRNFNEYKAFQVNERKAEEREVKTIVKKYLNSIPEHYSVILNMFFINELSHDEISNILKLPIGTIKNRIFRAKEKLKEILLRAYKEEELLEYIV